MVGKGQKCRWMDIRLRIRCISYHMRGMGILCDLIYLAAFAVAGAVTAAVTLLLL